MYSPTTKALSIKIDQGCAWISQNGREAKPSRIVQRGGVLGPVTAISKFPLIVILAWKCSIILALGLVKNDGQTYPPARILLKVRRMLLRWKDSQLNAATVRLYLILAYRQQTCQKVALDAHPYLLLQLPPWCILHTCWATKYSFQTHWIVPWNVRVISGCWNMGIAEVGKERYTNFNSSYSFKANWVVVFKQVCARMELMIPIGIGRKKKYDSIPLP